MSSEETWSDVIKRYMQNIVEHGAGHSKQPGERKLNWNCIE